MIDEKEWREMKKRQRADPWLGSLSQLKEITNEGLYFYHWLAPCRVLDTVWRGLAVYIRYSTFSGFGCLIIIQYSGIS